MREAKIILPSRADYAEAHQKLRAKLLDHFGGFSTTAGHGAWRDPAGKVHYDEMIAYTIAFHANAASNELIARLARALLQATPEQAIYTVDFDGAVAIIYRDHEER